MSSSDSIQSNWSTSGSKGELEDSKDHTDNHTDDHTDNHTDDHTEEYSEDHTEEYPQDEDVEKQTDKRKKKKGKVTKTNVQYGNHKHMQQVDHYNNYNTSGVWKRLGIVLGTILGSALIIYVGYVVGAYMFDSKCPDNLKMFHYTPSENELPCGPTVDGLVSRVGRCNVYYGSSYNDMYAVCTNNDETQIYEYECNVEATLNTSCIESSGKGTLYFAAGLIGVLILAALIATWAFLAVSPAVACWHLLVNYYEDENHYMYKRVFIICVAAAYYGFTALAFVQLYPYMINNGRNYHQYKDEFKCNIAQKCISDASNCVTSDRYCYMINPMHQVLLASLAYLACHGIVLVSYLVIYGLWRLGKWILFQR